MEKENNWEKQQRLIEKISNSNFWKYLKEIDQNKLKEAIFNPVEAPVRIVCIDEGVYLTGEGGEKMAELNIAGSGILRPVEEIVEDVLELITEKNLNIVEITSHDDCGAAALAKNDNPRAWTEELVKNINIKLASHEVDREIVHKHILADNMCRGEHHEAAMVIFNTDELLFSPRVLQDEEGNQLLPNAFIVDARYIKDGMEIKDNPIAQLEVALNISFGHNTFQDNFSEGHPLQLIVVGGNNNYDSFSSRIDSLVEKFLEENKYLEIQYTDSLSEL